MQREALPVRPGGMGVVKQGVARALDVAGVSGLLHRIQVSVFSPFVRAVNYHGFPPGSASAFEEHLRYYVRNFHPLGLAELTAFLAGDWTPPEKPGLILTFDDGLRSQCEVAGPLLDRYGIPGWFFLPVRLLGLPAAEQRDAAMRHDVIDSSEELGDRVFMTWEQARSLRARHVIGCHTAYHRRLSATLSPEVFESEVGHAKRELERELGDNVSVFCWVGGEEHAYSQAGAAAIRRAGYTASFMTNHALIRRSTNPLQLQRSNVEVGDPLWLIRFQMSGAMDLAYTFKRRRVNRLTATPNGRGEKGHAGAGEPVADVHHAAPPTDAA